MTSKSFSQQSRDRVSTTPRVVALVAAALLQFVLARATIADDAAKPAPAPPAGSSTQVEITSTATSWDNLSELFLGNTPAEPFADGSMFVIRGELRNTGDRPVRYVLLRFELLDDKGKVVHDIEGYNRSAESMRPDEEGKAQPEKVKPIPAGGIDSYRMVFFHDEVPRFASQRVRVIEVHE